MKRTTNKKMQRQAALYSRAARIFEMEPAVLDGRVQATFRRLGLDKHMGGVREQLPRYLRRFESDKHIRAIREHETPISLFYLSHLEIFSAKYISRAIPSYLGDRGIDTLLRRDRLEQAPGWGQKALREVGYVIAICEVIACPVERWDNSALARGFRKAAHAMAGHGRTLKLPAQEKEQDGHELALRLMQILPLLATKPRARMRLLELVS